MARNELEHIVTKEEALAAIVQTLKIDPQERDEQSYDQLLLSLENRAKNLGANGYDLMRANFEGTPTDERQLLLEMCLDDLPFLNISESSRLLTDLQKIIQDFDLKDPRN